MGADNTHEDPQLDEARTGEASASKSTGSHMASGCDADALRRVNLLLWWAFSQTDREE